MNKELKAKELEKTAWELRLKALKMVYHAKSGHLGGSFSAAEILSVLYFHTAKLDPENPDWEHRDRIFISKGHCAPIYYAALAKRGYFPEEELFTLRQLGSRLQGHPDRNKLPGIEMSSGPLGLGASTAVGTALGLRQKNNNSRVYCLLGDGEMQEGIVWEAAMTAAKYKPGNLVFILDYNHYQLSGSVASVQPIEPVEAKWKSFGWNAFSINGHRVNELLDAFSIIRRNKTAVQQNKAADKPLIIIANTVKGKGVSFMENTSKWHGRVPSDSEMEAAVQEISARLAGIKTETNEENSKGIIHE
ncbi:MAG: transketolase [Spirochaetes bacterium]|nr:MAG: transketolase [Spirochaetota bacterium]